MSAAPPRMVEVACAVGAFAVAAVRILEESRRGFPDGHLTELERVLRLPHVGLTAVLVVLGVVLLGRWRGPRWVLPMAALGVAALDWVVLPAVAARMGLDAGGGG